MRLPRFLLLLICFEALPALYFLLRIPSKESSGLFFGYSASRLALASIALLIFFMVLFFNYRAWMDVRWLSRRVESLEQWLLVPNRLQVTLVILAYLSVAGLLLLLFLISPLSIDMDTARAVFGRAAGLFIWGWLICVQSLIFIAGQFAGLLKQPGLFIRRKAIALLVLLVLISLTLFHWWVLVFRESLFTGIKGWYWQFHLKGFSIRDGLFLLMTAAILLGLLFTLRHPYKRRNLFLLFALGAFIQIGYGVLDGHGVESLRQEYIDTAYVHYAEHASDRPPVLYALSHYEEIYGRTFMLKTKPPGTLLAYLLTEKISSLLMPEGVFHFGDGFDGRFNRLTTFAAWIFPLFSMLVLFPLAWIAVRMFANRDLLPPLALYILCPNVVLITLVLDQVLFPLLFVCGVGLVILAVERKSFWLSVFAGGYLYLTVYFSFSLLPVVVMAFGLVGLSAWKVRFRPSLQVAFRLAVGMVIGLVSAYLLFRYLLDYDLFLRYANALAQHREHKRFAADFMSFITALFINNVEFILWVGVPVSILAGVQVVQSAVIWVKRRASRLDWLAVTFGLTYLVTNLMGQTRSEVGRLWLFFVPLVVLFAAAQLRHLDQKTGRWLWLVILMQWFTVFLTYKFQDFY